MATSLGFKVTVSIDFTVRRSRRKTAKTLQKDRCGGSLLARQTAEEATPGSNPRFSPQ